VRHARTSPIDQRRAMEDRSDSDASGPRKSDGMPWFQLPEHKHSSCHRGTSGSLDCLGVQTLTNRRSRFLAGGDEEPDGVGDRDVEFRSGLTPRRSAGLEFDLVSASPAAVHGVSFAAARAKGLPCPPTGFPRPSPRPPP
jgi:hypothetical protein